MPSATPYDRQFSFALFSAENPLVPHSGVSLDAEFNAVKVALDETQQNLARIQDDDGVLKRGSVGRAQLDSSISIGFAAPASWQPNTAYDAEVSTVFYASKFYICTETHVSGPVFEAARWEEIADFTVAAIIDDGSITSAKLADGAVASNKIADGSISNAKLASGAVSESKIANESVSLAKLATSLPTELAKLIIPAGLGPLPWSMSTLPAGWDWADWGVLLSDTAFPVLRAALIADGFPHGQDGSGNPRKPDARGRVVAGTDEATGRLTGATLGATLGAQTVTLTGPQLPFTTLTFTGSSGVVNVTSTVSEVGYNTARVGFNIAGFGSTVLDQSGFVTPGSMASTGSFTPTGTVSSFGSNAPHSNVQATLACKMIIKAH